MSLKSQSNLRTNSLQYLVNEPLNVLKLIVDRILWIEMIEISSFNLNFRHFASKGRDALKPNFNKWPEEPFLDGKNGSSGHLLKLGFKASRPLLAQNNFRHFAKIRLGMPT